jgi:hypothetical protein
VGQRVAACFLLDGEDDARRPAATAATAGCAHGGRDARAARDRLALNYVADQLEGLAAARM